MTPELHEAMSRGDVIAIRVWDRYGEWYLFKGRYTNAHGIVVELQ